MNKVTFAAILLIGAVATTVAAQSPHETPNAEKRINHELNPNPDAEGSTYAGEVPQPTKEPKPAGKGTPGVVNSGDERGWGTDPLTD